MNGRVDVCFCMLALITGVASKSKRLSLVMAVSEY